MYKIKTKYTWKETIYPHLNHKWLLCFKKAKEIDKQRLTMGN